MFSRLICVVCAFGICASWGWSQAAPVPLSQHGPVTVWHKTHSHPACQGSSCTWPDDVLGQNGYCEVHTTLRGRTCCDDQGVPACFETVAKSTLQEQGPHWYSSIELTPNEKVIEHLEVVYNLNDPPADDTQETSNQGACSTNGRCCLAYYHLEYRWWYRNKTECTGS